MRAMIRDVRACWSWYDCKLQGHGTSRLLATHGWSCRHGTISFARGNSARTRLGTAQVSSIIRRRQLSGLISGRGTHRNRPYWIRADSENSLSCSNVYSIIQRISLVRCRNRWSAVKFIGLVALSKGSATLNDCSERC